MQRTILFALLAATVLLGFVEPSQAQLRFGIGVGRGHRLGDLWRNPSPLNQRRHSRDSNNRTTQQHKYHVEQSGWHKVETKPQRPVSQPAKPQVQQPWEGAHRVVHVDNNECKGVYYEREKKQYFTDDTGTTQLVSHGGFNHVDGLSARLELLTNELCLELHYNYRHNQGFRYTYKNVYDAYQLAKYIHGLERDGEQEDIARRLDGLDRLFHFVREDVNDWSRREDRRIGGQSLEQKIEAVQSTVHHLMNDVGVKIAMIVEEPPVPENLVDLPPLP